MGTQKEWKAPPCCVGCSLAKSGDSRQSKKPELAPHVPVCWRSSSVLRPLKEKQCGFWFHLIVVTSCQLPHWWPLTNNSAAEGCRDSIFHSLTPCAKGQHMEMGAHEGPGQSDGTTHPRRSPPLCRSVVLRRVGWGRGGRAVSRLICVVVRQEPIKHCKAVSLQLRKKEMTESIVVEQAEPYPLAFKWRPAWRI